MKAPCAAPIARCDRSTCEECFEIIDGYEICAGGARDQGITECPPPPPGSGPSFEHRCCSDADCASGELCGLFVPEFYGHQESMCQPSDECAALTDCNPPDICMPRLYEQTSTACQPAATCLTDADCPAGAVCAPVLYSTSTSGGGGNTHTWHTVVVQCIIEPGTCTP